ncbi:hypothetical protein ACFVYP_03685 [Kitasatospora sp. NPDC058201]|uniref:hypothetical protein n=1 Tax=unclassified Kitasatospora TaxID=2633591 RepID=UPI00364AC1E4
MPDSFLSKAGRQRIRQAEERAAKTYQRNVAAQKAFISLARHIEAEKYTAQIVTRLRAEERCTSGVKEFKRRRDLDAALRKHSKAVRDVTYARGLLLRAERNPRLAVQAVQPAKPPRTRGRSNPSPRHAEPMWIGSHWTRSTS